MKNPLDWYIDKWLDWVARDTDEKHWGYSPILGRPSPYRGRRDKIARVLSTVLILAPIVAIWVWIVTHEMSKM